MRQHPRPEIELEPITISKPLTDLEKFQKLFDEIGIEYEISEREENTSEKYINVKAPFDDEDEALYIQVLNVNFTKDDEFKDFYVIGD